MNVNYWNTCYQGVQGGDIYDGWLAPYADVICPGVRTLDLGCGAGTNLAALLAMGAVVTAADFSENAVSAVQAQFNGKLDRADCFDMRLGFPYGDALFDAVIADLSLHYFSWSETAGIIAEIRRILCSGGRLIARVHSLDNLPPDASDPIEDHYYMVDGYSRRYFTPEDIRLLFEGWKICRLDARRIHRYGRIKHVIEFTAQKP